MRIPHAPILASLLAAAATAGIASADRGADGEHRDTDAGPRAYSVGLWGDMPYNDVQKTDGVPRLIADMNSQKLAFTANDGDLKKGSGPCPDSLYTDAKARFNTLQAPAAFTPGDNDWTDCDRNPGTSSYERLQFERKTLFDTSYTLGQRRLRQEVQGGHGGPDDQYVENRRWTVGRVVYATLNVQGSCNNLCDVAPDPSEETARTDADIRWLRGTFAAAKADGAAAVMVIFQADPGWDDSDATRAPVRNAKTLAETDGQPDGYASFLTALRDETVAFGKPVAAVHGDSHYFRVDKPLQDTAGRRVQNFTRVETFGDHAENDNNDVQWLKVDVDPRSRGVFSFQPQIIPANAGS